MSAQPVGSTPVGSLHTEHSGLPVSRASRWVSRGSRVLVRPAIAALGSAYLGVIRFGPAGAHRWPVWQQIAHQGDRVGALLPPVAGTTLTPTRLPFCRAEWIRAAGVGEDAPAVLYFHGGGLIAGGLRSHRRMLSRVSAAAGAQILNVEFRLLLGSTMADAVQDGVDGYRALLAAGVPAHRVVLGGDSGGGGLAVLVAAAARDEGLPTPGGLLAISPWADFDPAAKLAHPNAGSDPMIPIQLAPMMATHVLATSLEEARSSSPVNIDLSGLPPTLIHTGSTEVLAADADLLGQRLAAAGSQVQVKVWTQQVHVFHLLADVVPEARAAVEEIGRFVRTVTGGAR